MNEIAIYNATVPERMRDKIDTFGDCWLWTGAADPRGYGRTWFLGRVYLAHRAVYELVNNTDLGGRVLCHSCDTPACVRPSHMFAGTQADNLADMRAKGRHVKPECRNGHQRTEANTYMNSKGRRVCRDCERIRGRAKYLRRIGRAA